MVWFDVLLKSIFKDVEGKEDPHVIKFSLEKYYKTQKE